MVGVVFFFEDHQTNRQSGREVDIQVWRETVKPLGADRMIMVDQTLPGSTYQHTDEEIAFEKHSTLESALNAYPDKTWVFTAPEVSIPGARVYDKEPAPALDYVNLVDFVHPTDEVIYVIGPDSTGLPLSKIAFPARSHLVTITTPRNHDLWSFIVAALVLFDRKNKLNLWP